MFKKFAFIFLVATFIVTGCNQSSTTPKPESNTNTTISAPRPNDAKSNSNIVAKVGSITISEEQLSKQVEIKKKAFETLKKPQTEEFYKKVALGLLIKNALIDTDAQRMGSVSPQEASEYLRKQMNEMQSRGDTDPAKIEYLNVVKVNGFNNPSEYVASPEIISVTQKELLRNKFQNLIIMSSSLRTPADAWHNYVNQLLNAKQYEILVPIDITGIEELESAATK
jgi:hypothetical protein